MRAEWFLATAAQMGGYAVAQSVDAPDFVTKLLGILAGTFAGALLSAVISETSTTNQRIRRGIAALCAGPVLSLIALANWPTHVSYDPREWIFVIAFGAAFAAWFAARKLDERGESAADSLADMIETRYGIKPAKRERDEHEDSGP